MDVSAQAAPSFQPKRKIIKPIEDDSLFPTAIAPENQFLPF
jgi:hypothetical protein